jgi:hypothetical protein
MISRNNGGTGPASRLLLCLIGAIMLCAPGNALFAADTPKSRADLEQRKIPFPRPQSHTGNWLEYHGRSVEPSLNTALASDTSCLTCHEKTDCISCHNTQPPRDHTNTWRNLSHGFMAEGNRERCQTCHRQDFCVRCHNETAPRSHVGNWRTGHCTWCHYGSGLAPADNCVVCHRKAPHSSAPHVVNPQADCTLCHR